MKQIGKVKVHYLPHSEDLNDSYQDSAEEFLFNFFDKPQYQKEQEINAILNNNPSWPILYHLSPQREFLLSWYPFKKNSDLLEIGAGCGSLTGMFSNKLKHVYTNELTPIRAETIARRFAEKDNIQIYVGNLNELNLNKKVEYVSVVGVLEYAGKFIPADSDLFHKPYVKFLSFIKKYLKPNGHLLLAIENKLALKYIAGGKEDHYSTLFSSLENYPNYQGIRTFTKTELTDLFHEAGFKKVQFYFPYPDYKLPYHVFSEEGLHHNLPLSLSAFAKIVDFSNERVNLFNEIAFAYNLSKEKIFEKFANAFLVDAQL